MCPTDVCQEEALIKPDIGVEDIGVRVWKWTHLVSSSVHAHPYEDARCLDGDILSFLGGFEAQLCWKAWNKQDICLTVGW